MTRQRVPVGRFVAVLVGLAVEGVTAVQTGRHSGTLLTLDAARGTGGDRIGADSFRRHLPAAGAA